MLGGDVVCPGGQWCLELCGRGQRCLEHLGTRYPRTEKWRRKRSLHAADTALPCPDWLHTTWPYRRWLFRSRWTAPKPQSPVGQALSTIYVARNRQFSRGIREKDRLPVGMAIGFFLIIKKRAAQMGCRVTAYVDCIVYLHSFGRG